jgi:hypothetical protein
VGRSAGHAVICHASVASSHTALHSSLSERTGCDGLIEGGGAEERGCCCVTGRRLGGSGTSWACFPCGLSLRVASWIPRGVGASGGSTAAICDSNRLRAPRTSAKMHAGRRFEPFERTRGEWVLRGTVGRAGAPPLGSACIEVVVWPRALSPAASWSRSRRHRRLAAACGPLEVWMAERQTDIWIWGGARFSRFLHRQAAPSFASLRVAPFLLASHAHGAKAAVSLPAAAAPT